MGLIISCFDVRDDEIDQRQLRLEYIGKYKPDLDNMGRFKPANLYGEVI